MKYWQFQIFAERVKDPNVFLKFTPIGYRARFCPPWISFQGSGSAYLKHHPHFWAVGCDSTDLAQQICAWGLSKTVELVCTRSSHSSAPLLPVCGARQAWQLLCHRHGKLTALDRLLELCGTSDGPFTPHASDTNWKFLRAPVSSLLAWGDRVLAIDWTQSLVSLHTCAVDKAKTRSQTIKM